MPPPPPPPPPSCTVRPSISALKVSSASYGRLAAAEAACCSELGGAAPRPKLALTYVWHRNGMRCTGREAYGRLMVKSAVSTRGEAPPATSMYVSTTAVLRRAALRRTCATAAASLASMAGRGMVASIMGSAG